MTVADAIPLAGIVAIILAAWHMLRGGRSGWAKPLVAAGLLAVGGSASPGQARRSLTTLALRTKAAKTTWPQLLVRSVKSITKGQGH